MSIQYMLNKLLHYCQYFHFDSMALSQISQIFLQKIAVLKNVLLSIQKPHCEWLACCQPVIIGTRAWDKIHIFSRFTVFYDIFKLIGYTYREYFSQI